MIITCLVTMYMLMKWTTIITCKVIYWIFKYTFIGFVWFFQWLFDEVLSSHGFVVTRSRQIGNWVYTRTKYPK